MWLGYGFNGGNAFFKIPKDTNRDYANGVYDENTGLVKFRNCHWFTNLDIQKRHEEMDLVCHYSPEQYPSYDNYNAIEVGKTVDIPCDYDGLMGVPITFLTKYSPEQFEIVGVLNHGCDSIYDKAKPILWGKELYSRILIRNKHPKKL